MSDDSSNSDELGGRFRPFAEMLVSLRFLTRLPIPFVHTIDLPPLAQAMRLFGFAGALIGAANGVVLLLLFWLHVSGLIAAALTIAFGICLTGALHEDGLADMADGLFGGKSIEQRLLIMKDSRIGTFGACALVVVLLIRCGAYQSLASLPAATIIIICAAVGAFSRAMVVDMMWATKAARSDGLSVSAGRPGRGSALFAIITAGALTLYVGAYIRADSGIFALAAAGILTAGIRRLAIKLIGGQTGDICGAVQVVSEIGMLTAIVATIG